MDKSDAGQMYMCPMHTDVRQPGAGTCSKCGMKLMPEGTRFALLQHVLSSPLHIAVMVALMLAVMAVAMMIAR